VIVEKSEELRGLLSSLIETFGTPRMGQASTGAITAEPGVLMVGTDPAEWWSDPDDLLRVVQRQSKELQGDRYRNALRGMGPGRGRLGRGKGRCLFP
jgi:hypothetical protein